MVVLDAPKCAITDVAKPADSVHRGSANCKRPAIPFVQCAAGNGPAFPGVGLDLYLHGG